MSQWSGQTGILPQTQPVPSSISWSPQGREQHHPSVENKGVDGDSSCDNIFNHKNPMRNRGLFVKKRNVEKHAKSSELKEVR